jgi:CRISPR-associated endoribonuclease Cas6
MIEMRARMDYAYENTYHRNLRARVYEEIDGNGDYDIHDCNKPGLFSYSAPFPERDACEGDRRRLLFAAYDPELITTVIRGLCKRPELNIGEMPLKVEQAYMLDPQVCERGELTTDTAVLIRFDQKTAEEYGINTKYDQTYWRTEHGMDLFFERLNENIQMKYRLAFNEEPPEPPYFGGYELEREVVKPIEYDGNAIPHIGHKWTFEYEIESAKHRKLLNLVLAAGLGQLNGLGFGFVNRAEDVNRGGNE